MISRPMKPLALFFLLFVSLMLHSTAVVGQTSNVASLLVEAKAARDSYQDAKALVLFEKVLLLDSINKEALYNAGYMNSRLGWIQEDYNVELAKHYYTRSKYYADKVYKYYPNTFEANLLMAGAIARLTKYGTTKERVTGAWDIKKYADVAFKMKPDDPLLRHMLAWWNFELSKPTWFERSMADMLFGGIPKGADVNLAIKTMKELITKRPDYIVYRYDLALFYEYLGDKLNARQWLESAMKLTPKTPEEFPYIPAGKKFLARLQ